MIYETGALWLTSSQQCSLGILYITLSLRGHTCTHANTHSEAYSAFISMHMVSWGGNVISSKPEVSSEVWEVHKVHNTGTLCLPQARSATAHNTASQTQDAIRLVHQEYGNIAISSSSVESVSRTLQEPLVRVASSEYARDAWSGGFLLKYSSDYWKICSNKKKKRISFIWYFHSQLHQKLGWEK